LQRDSQRIPVDLADRVADVLGLQSSILTEVRSFSERRIHATRIRCHGDCKLDQVLSTGRDFVFLDFEGRPNISLGERRLKRSAFRDVVGLLRSFDYAAHATLFGLISGRGKAAGVIRNEDRPSLISWTKAWRLWVHESFKDGYFDTVGQESFVPQDPAERTILFRIMLLEKLLAEIMGELRNRPHWLGIPIHGLLEVMTSETI
jgi:maltose alpha-D-glucosyltransferase/alpha-amylase